MLGKSLRYKVAGAVTVLAAVVGAAGMSAVAGASVPATSSTPVAFTGAVSCTVSGRMLASPPLTMTSEKTILTLSATLSGCGGSTKQHNVTINKGVLTASTTLTASCMSFTTSKKLAPTGTIRWSATGGTAAATRISFTSASSSVSTGNGAITVSLPGTGTAKTTGSFAGTGSKATIVFDQQWNALAGQCILPFGGGISELSFTGQLGPSAASIG